jgi:hypothetical protein
MKIEHLENLIILSEELNFTKAADRISRQGSSIDQPQLSRQVRAIEKELGQKIGCDDIPLFEVNPLLRRLLDLQSKLIFFVNNQDLHLNVYKRLLLHQQL